MPQAERAPAAALLVWIAAFVLHRGAVLAFGFDGVFFWEESYRLLAAEALRGGWAIPLHDLQADPYAGGSLVFSVLTAAATAVAGSSLLVLKSVALAWNALGFWFWLAATNHRFGARAAHLLGFVWIAAPPVFVVFNVLALGSHSDAVTLTGLQLLLLYRWLDEPSRTGRLLAFAAAGGLGVWFTYSAALPLAAMVAYALFTGALPPVRWPVAAAGFAAGFSPWIAHYLATGGSSEVLQQTFAGAGGGRSYFANLWDIAVRGVPVALYFRDIGVPGDVKVSRELLAYPYLAVYAAAFGALVFPLVRDLGGAVLRERGAPFARALAIRPELAALAIFPLFLLVVAASNQEFNDYGLVRYITFRIVVPALPSVFFAIALFGSRTAAPLRAAMLAVCLATALVGTGQLVLDGNGSRPVREAEARELGARAMGHLLVFKHGEAPALFRERIGALPMELRAPAWRGIGENVTLLFTRQRAASPAAELTAALLACDPVHRADCIEGARLASGPGLFQVYAMSPSPRRDELLAAIEAAAAQTR
jgi:hypothetical protein